MADLNPDQCQLIVDPNFPITCVVDYKKAYCCVSDEDTNNTLEDFVFCDAGLCKVNIITGCNNMSFNELNNEGAPTLKTSLNATTKSAWVKLSFQAYCGGYPDSILTAQNILTMGNMSQPCNDEKCKAVITAFQYGWGTVNQGNRCRFTILDQKGSSFQQWIERMGINAEGDTTPIKGKYRMKVQFGWYITGGSPEDVCGQPAKFLGNPDCGTNSDLVPGGVFPVMPANPGENSAFIICSPVMWFITDWINVHYENGKFIYELEGTDTLVRGQENTVNRHMGLDVKKRYFTSAVEELGRTSFPPFRVDFLALDANGNTVPMEFSKRDGVNADREKITDQLTVINPDDMLESDCLGYGPYEVWRSDQKAPLAVVHEWLKKGVFAKDLTAKVVSDKSRVGITMNFDPTYVFVPDPSDICKTCNEDIPQYGRLVLWANGIPYCQGNFNDDEINKRVKAVYIVNGGNCSPVLHFAPSFRWHNFAAQRQGGVAVPITSPQNQSSGIVKTNCPIAASTGPNKMVTVVPTDQSVAVTDPQTQTQEATFHHIMANLPIGAIEADLRVEGDPSAWLCSPAYQDNSGGYARCIGIVFVNPYFLEIDPNSPVRDCPNWFASDPNSEDAQLRSICNQLLTSKGWFIMGVDHQIKDGQFTTTLKVKLLAPGSEILPAEQNPLLDNVVKLGAWVLGTALPYGGQIGCFIKYLVGNLASFWANSNPDGPLACPPVFTGGGTPCGVGYTTVPNAPDG